MDDIVTQIVKICKSKAIPVVFALRKKKLGKAIGRNKASAVGNFPRNFLKKLLKLLKNNK